jgi:hypothetical protein
MAHVLERGDLFFFYRPRVDETEAHSVEDVQRFAGRRFAPLVPEFLDVAGAELALIAASSEVATDLELELDPERESLRTAKLFTDLALDRRGHPSAPLIEGDWG